MRIEDNVPSGMPVVVAELSRFLQRTTSMGLEMAFWRTKKQSRQLERGVTGLLAIAEDADFFAIPPDRAQALLEHFAKLQSSLRRLVAVIPFQKRVNLLHRPLVPCYQQIMILDNLTAAILCRLQRQSNVTPMRTIPKGSLLGTDAKRELRGAIHEVVPSWDRKAWNLYDTV